MKLISLSIAAVVAMSTLTALKASSLEEALKNGKMSGKIQAYNFTTNRKKDFDSSINTLGFDLSYETARYNGFGIKTTFQSATSPGIDENAKKRHKNDMWGSGAQLSEIYLSYKGEKTLVKAGRMYMGTNLISGSGSRVNKEAFQGAIITNSDLPDTTVTVAYVNKELSRTDGEGNFGSFTTKATGWAGGDFSEGAYTVDISNKSFENIELTAAYLDVIDRYETAYFEAEYRKDIYGLASQYYYSQQEGQDDANLFGIKADVTFGAVNLLAAYATVDDIGVIPGLGNGADNAYTWSEAHANQYIADQDSYKLALKYTFNKNAYVGTSYVQEEGVDYTKAYTAIKGSYSFTGTFEGLNIFAAYEVATEDADGSQLRLKINYNF